MSATTTSPRVIAGAILILFSTACRQQEGTPPLQQQAGGRHGGQVVVGIAGDVTTFNDYQSLGDATEARVIGMLFPTLMIEQPDFHEHPPSFSPALATSWEFSDDNRVLTFKLRSDARWSDGVPVTAEDVRFSFQAQKDPNVAWINAEAKDLIEEVEVLDPHTVRFHFSRSYPYQLMDANDGHIVPAHRWGAVPFDRWHTTDFSKHMVTSGPFTLASHTRQQTIILERDPRYWGHPRPLLDRVVFRIVPDAAAMVSQLLAGRIHVVEMIPPRDADRVRQHQDLRLVEVPSRLWGFLGWNNRRAPFDDPRVRRALTMAINRQALVESVYHGYARLANGPVLSSMWAYNEDLPVLPFDTRRARELLAEAGWRDTTGDGWVDRNGQPLVIDLLYPATNIIRQEMAVLIQSDLARVGVRVRPVAMEFSTMLARQDAGDFDAVMAAWEEATKVDLTAVWSTPGDDSGFFNFVGYSNPEVDHLIAAARLESDPKRAKLILDRVQELIVADQPVTFLYEVTQLVGIHRRILGTDINAASVFFNIEEWYWGS